MFKKLLMLVGLVCLGTTAAPAAETIRLFVTSSPDNSPLFPQYRVVVQGYINTELQPDGSRVLVGTNPINGRVYYNQGGDIPVVATIGSVIINAFSIDAAGRPQGFLSLVLSVPYQLEVSNEHLYVIDLDDPVAGGFIDRFLIGDAVDAVPEPGSWVLMIGGLGFVGGLLRRRGSAASL